MHERRSIIWSIAAPILFAVIGAVVLAGAALGWSLTRTIEQGLRAEIALDIAAIRQHEERLRVVAVADAIDHRIQAAPATSAGLYVLVDRDGSAVIGNLPGIPSGAEEDNWIRFSAATTDGRAARWIGRRQPLTQGYTLFVARRADGFWVTVNDAAPALAGIAFAALALVGFALARTSRRMASAVSELNDVIAAARAGAPDRRLVSTGQPREVAELGAQINILLDTIERQLGNMRRLSAQAAHELSSPLARVVTRLSQASDPDVIATCRDELQETLALLQALLDIAEQESEPGVAAEVLDLATVCASVCAVYADAAADRSITVARALSPAHVRGEASLLTRAVANLLDNAIKASPPGSTVTVATGEEPSHAYLSVTDEGSGIANQSLDDLLVAARGRPREPGSHGLGLRFTRAIALRHGAVLTASNTASKGSVFRISFPVITA